MSDQRVLGGVGTKVLMENDRVRIWEMRLAPGQESDVHRHDLDYVLVQIDGDRIAGVPEPDSAGEYNEYIEADVVPGNFVYIGRGGIETARNVGNKQYYEILIELKD
jgi:beta-alanine degradation protein BauB